MSQKTEQESRTPEQIASAVRFHGKETKSFATKATALMLAWLVLAELILRFVVGMDTPLFVYVIILYSGGLTILIHRMLVKANDKRPAQFVNLLMGMIGAKMVLSLLILVVLAFLSSKEAARVILISFVPVYFGNAGLQIFSILRFMEAEKARKAKEVKDMEEQGQAPAE